ncbi:MAG: NAD regulator [Parvibaculaceae bacterium]|nr:NAD regulator [Parvibaculaceae bacterium]
MTEAPPAAPRKDPDIADVAVVIGLNAAIVTVADGQPKILVVPQDGDDASSRWDALPFGPFDPFHHRTLEIGLRSWVQEQTKLTLGYVEQLYTFGDRGRHATELKEQAGEHVVSVGYLALTRTADSAPAGAVWRDWYDHFPWDDWRDGKPAIIDQLIVPLLREWANDKTSTNAEELVRGRRLDRVRLCFGTDGVQWDEEKVLERYELLYEAGLLREAARDGRPNALARRGAARPPLLGRPMQYDHRRILATAMSRLRSKIKYRPVAFEMMPPVFTLYELQKTVEALLGLHVHKQNFRRLVEKGGLVERTGRVTTQTGGRPAEQFRFRREVLAERPAPGLKLAPSRSRANS